MSCIIRQRDRNKVFNVFRLVCFRFRVLQEESLISLKFRAFCAHLVLQELLEFFLFPYVLCFPTQGLAQVSPFSYKGTGRVKHHRWQQTNQQLSPHHWEEMAEITIYCRLCSELSVAFQIYSHQHLMSANAVILHSYLLQHSNLNSPWPQSQGCI